MSSFVSGAMRRTLLSLVVSLAVVIVAQFVNPTSLVADERQTTNQQSTQAPSRDQTLDIYREAAEKWIPDIQKLTQDNATAGASDAVLCLGSSSFRIWDSIGVDMAPHRMVRRAFGGSKFSDLAIHIDQLIAGIEFKAVAIFVGNDITGEPDDKTPDEVARLAAIVIERIRRERPTAKIYLIAVTPTPKRFGVWDKICESNNALEALANRIEDAVFIPTQDAFLGIDRKPKNELFQKDQLHLNAEGYRVWAAILKAAIEREANNAK